MVGQSQLRPKPCLDVAQTLAKGQLRESQRQEVLPRFELQPRRGLVMALRQSLEQPVRNYIDDLREDGSPDVHRAPTASAALAEFKS